MATAKLAYVNMKRIMRHKGLKITFWAVPLAVALLRIAFADNTILRYAAKFCPVACALIIGAVLYTQWSVDITSGLITGLCSCPISRRAIVFSRVLSGACIFVVQMILFVSILAIRF